MGKENCTKLNWPGLPGSLIIIPSLNHNYQRAVDENSEMIDWIIEQYHKGAEIASIQVLFYLLHPAC